MGNGIKFIRNTNIEPPKITVVYHRKTFLIVPFEVRHDGEIIPVGNWSDADWDDMIVSKVYSTQIDFERGILKH